jgi:hypothetical protein
MTLGAISPKISTTTVTTAVATVAAVFSPVIPVSTRSATERDVAMEERVKFTMLFPIRIAVSAEL